MLSQRAPELHSTKQLMRYLASLGVEILGGEILRSITAGFPVGMRKESRKLIKTMSEELAYENPFLHGLDVKIWDLCKRSKELCV